MAEPNTSWNFDEDLGGTFAMDVPDLDLRARKAAELPDEDPTGPE